MADKDEKISLILGAIGAIWIFGGLILIAFLARWLRTAWGIAYPGLEEGLAVLYLISLGIIVMTSIYFQVRSYIKRGNIFGIFLFIFQIILVFALGRAISQLLRGG
ncbi:MAG: hypothetical protein J7452_14065 [Thermoflexus sp.]|jgi:hypothetical protein|nr:hypothetical protein [Thermoflexus sp.]